MKLINECYWWLTEIMIISYPRLHSYLVKKARQADQLKEAQDREDTEPP